MSTYFLHFGETLFKKFEYVKSSLGELILPNVSPNLCGFAFDSLVIGEKELKLSDVYSCWSFALFIVEGRIFYCGFKDTGICNLPVLIYPESQDSLPSKIQKFSAGWNRALFITENGICFSISDGEFVSLDISVIKEGLKEIYAADFQNIFVNEDGCIYKSGALMVPQLIPLSRKVLDVACGKEHTLLLTACGSIYSFGVGSRGQLGHGSTDSYDKPLLVEALDGIVIRSIEAGGWHSAAVSVHEDLYTWGWNESGQLGRPCNQLCIDNSALKDVEEICCLPKLVNLEPIPIKSVSLGSRHSAVLLGDLTVWTWGWNGYGQLGHDAKPCLDYPRCLELPSSFTPQSIQCFLWSTVITVTHKV